MIKDKKRLITVVGYYGMGNLGDELLLHNLVEYLPGNQYKFNVLINQGARRDILQNAHTIYTEKKDVIGLIKTLWKSEYLFFTGGFILSNNSFRYYSLISIFAYLFKTKVTFFSIGTSRINRNFINKILFSFWNKFHFVSVRDKLSLRNLNSVKRIQLLPDLSFLPEPHQIKNTSNIKNIGFNPRNIQGEKLDVLIKPFKEICDLYPKSTIYYIFSTSVGQNDNQDDNNVCEVLNDYLLRLGYNTKVINIRNLDELEELTNELDLSYNFRLHSYLHNLLKGVPSYIFSHPKILKTSAMLDSLGLNESLIFLNEKSEMVNKPKIISNLNLNINQCHKKVIETISEIGL